jgi:ketosteroid isomerase-like protein
MSLATDALDDWLWAYGQAWESKDPEGFGALFTQDAQYYWTPLEPPKNGRPQIQHAFENAVARQRDIHFDYELTLMDANVSIVHWRCRFRRVPGDHQVRLDGIMLVRMNDAGKCYEFREWWHSSEQAH